MPATPWLWAYWPVMNVAREGQQSGNESTASAKVVPARGEQALDVRHVRHVGRGLVVGHHDEDVRAAVLARPSAGRAWRRGRASAPSSARQRRIAAHRVALPRHRRRERTACVTQCQLLYDARLAMAPRRRRRPRHRRAPARARPASESRERIVAAATELVRERAYAELSVDEVMREAGIGRTIFYRHFDDLATCSCARAARRSRSSTRRSGASPGAARRGPGRGAAGRFEAAVASTSATARCCAASPRPPPATSRSRRDYAEMRERFDDLAEQSLRERGRPRPDAAGRPRRDRAGAEPDERELPARRVRPRAARVRPRPRCRPSPRSGTRSSAADERSWPMDVFRTPDERFENLPGLPLRAALRRGGRPAPPPPRRGQRPHRALLPRRAELELPLPAHARPARGDRAPGGLPRPRRASAAPTSRPTRAGTPTTATSRWSAATSTRSTSRT